MSFHTLNEALAARRSSTHAIHFIEADGSERKVDFGEVYVRALGLLHHFQAQGACPGSEMVLLLERNDQFIDALWACLLGGIVAVPLAPGATDEHRLKLFRVLEKLRQPHLCTDTKIFSRVTTYAAKTPGTTDIERLRRSTVFVDEIDDISVSGQIQPARPDDIAFVQYSSGSTSEPKGVTLTHRNLLTNIAAIAHGIDLAETDIGLSWMPLTHDMGLIGFHLTPLVTNVAHVLMSTAAFVRRPQLWLAKATEKKATILCSPNFGYRHFLKTFVAEKAAALDLAQVRILFNGAEPISNTLCQEFLATLAPFGLREAAMFPVYGLAEASLAVTFPVPGAGCATVTVHRDSLTIGATVEAAPPENSHAVSFVNVGHPVQGCEMRIADDDGLALPDGTVGHVRIRGDNVTRGYYQDVPATRGTIDQDGWLDTEDLGFNTPDGLVITGRAKDIMFVSGQNYYPHDLEEALATYAGIETGKAAVCGSRRADAESDVVLAFILHRAELQDFPGVAKKVRKSINEHIGLAVDHVIPVARIPKTTSGKVQRYLLAETYRSGAYESVIAELRNLDAATADSESAGPTEIEKNLKEVCDAFIKEKPLDLHDNIFELGTSSLTLAQIYERIEAIYPGQLEVTDFFDYPTIAELAKYLESRLAAAHT